MLIVKFVCVHPKIQLHEFQFAQVQIFFKQETYVEIVFENLKYHYSSRRLFLLYNFSLRTTTVDNFDPQADTGYCLCLYFHNIEMHKMRVKDENRQDNDFLYDPSYTSGQRSGADYLRSNNVKITFCGFRTKNEICSGGGIWHPIKAHLCQKTICININHFYQNFVHFTLSILDSLTHK